MSSKSQIEEKVIEIKANGVQANNTIHELARTARTLNKELKNLAPNSQEFINTTKRLTEVKDRLDQVANQAYRSGKAWAEFKKQALSVTAGVLGGSILTTALNGLIGFFSQGVTGAAKLSDELANIGKVTSLTNAELKELNDNLTGLNTRTSKSELRDLAVAAGKLGIDGKRNILEFVKAADTIKIALGEDLGQDALISVGKLVNVFKLEEQFGIEQGMLKVASSINSVGQASEAAEPHIVDFLNQVGSTGQTVGVSVADLIGLAGALDSVGLTAEVSATAYKDTIIEFVRDTEKWAKVAGYSVGELSKILQSQGTNEAFLQFIQKLKESSTSQAEFLSKLQQLGINGARGANVFLTIADNIKEVRTQQDLANKSFDQGTSIAIEAAKKQATTAAIYEKFGKIFNSFLLNNPVSKFFQNVAEGFARLVVGTDKLSDSIKKEIVDLNLLKLKIFDTNTSSEERIRLIKEVQSLYPDLLSNIDAETINNDKLSAALQGVNKGLSEKLAIQKLLEKEQAKAEKVADRSLQKAETEAQLRELISTKAQEKNIRLKDGGTLSEMATEFLNQYKQTLKYGQDNTTIEISALLHTIKLQTADLQRAENRLKQTIEKNKELAKSMGVSYGQDTKYKWPGISGTQTNLPPVETQDEKTSRTFLSEEEKKAAEKAAKEYLKNTKKLLEDLKKLNVDAIADEEQRAVSKLAVDAQLRIADIKATEADAKVKAELIKAIEANLQTDISSIRKKYADERTKQEYNDTLKALNDNYSQQRIIAANNFTSGLTDEKAFNEQIEKIDQDYLQQKLTAAKDYGMDTLEIERQIAEGKIKWTQEDLKQFEDALRQKQNAQIAAGKLAVINTRANTQERLDAEIDLLHLQMEQELEVAKLTEEEKALIRAEYAEREADLRNQSYRNELDNVEDLTQKSLALYGQVIDNRLAKEKKATTSEFDFKMQKLETQLKRGLISEEEYRAEKLELENQYKKDLNAAERRAFKQKKQFALAQAHINTAMGVTRAFFDYSWPYNLIVGGFITAQGLAQYNKIQSEPEPEQFRRGKRLVGPSHENGGIQLYGNGGHFGEAEGDELILTKGVYRNPLGRKIASDLNEAFGGVRFDGYNSMTAPPRFEFGTIIGSSGFRNSNSTDISQMKDMLLNHELFMLEMAKRVQEIKDTKMEAFISYDIHKQGYEDVDFAKKR